MYVCMYVLTYACYFYDVSHTTMCVMSFNENDACLCARVCICMCVFALVCGCLCYYARVCFCTRVWLFFHARVDVCVHVCVCMCVLVFVVRGCACVHVCVTKYVHVYIGTCSLMFVCACLRLYVRGLCFVCTFFHLCCVFVRWQVVKEESKGTIIKTAACSAER